MKLNFPAVFCCSMVLSFPAFSQNTKATATSDQAFLDLAAQTDMAEANLGQLAATNAASQQVKDYAQMLVSDHTADYSKLGALATKTNLTIPKSLDAKHQRLAGSFQKLKGAAFDRRYIQEMVSGHEAAIAAYDKESRDGQNADLKAYAKDTLPTLEKHKNAAQDLAKKKR